MAAIATKAERDGFMQGLGAFSIGFGGKPLPTSEYPRDNIHPRVLAGFGTVPIIGETLFEYPGREVIHATPEALNSIMEEWGGAIPIPPRFAAREFCTPGGRLDLDASLLYPEDFKPRKDGSKIGCDEMWKLCVTKIVTGIKMQDGKSPFREGQAHAITPDGNLVSFQELIELDPERVVGRFIAQLSLLDPDILKATWPIVSKIFDNLNPIPHHLHFDKWEIHDPHQWLNPEWKQADHYTTPTGLHSHVTPEMLLEYLMEIGNENPTKNIRELSPAMPISAMYVTLMQAGVLHAPCGLATHEVHKLLDEHFLGEARTLDGPLSVEDCFGAVMGKHFPRKLVEAAVKDPSKMRELWSHFVHSKFDWDANQNPNFTRDCVKEPILAPEHCSEGVTSRWVAHGLMQGEQNCSVMRVEVEPGKTATFNFDTPFFAQTEAGEGMIGKLPIKKPNSIGKDQVSVDGKFQNAFISEGLSKDCTVKNDGNETLVLTFDFPPCAHRIVPGVEAEGGYQEQAWKNFDAANAK